MMRTIRGSFWKHPRLSGEDRPREALEHPGTETPPLTRGRPHSAQSRLRSPWKHPQLRGEDFCTCPTLIALIETPPLTRGRLCALQRNLPADGNTPAYAGKTTGRLGAGRIAEKHPRLRGEDTTHGLWMTVTVGNTPAYAGKTVKLVDLSNSLQKHPCLRGEDSRSAFSVDSTPETPPLTRGRLFFVWTMVVRKGNTPAYAGKTHERF